MSSYTPKSLIRVSSLSVTSLEQGYVNSVLRSGNLTQGRVVAQLEERFAALWGASHAVACNSGTSALHLAYLSLGLGSGDAIITSPLTYVATANAARYCGAEVLFADVREDDWTLSREDAKAVARHHISIGKLVIVPVHLYDAVAHTGYLQDVVQDSAHTPDLQSDGQMATYSFYASKVIGCGEGGMVTTNDPDLAGRMRWMRGQGMAGLTPDRKNTTATTPSPYAHTVVGYNYRMTDLHAAVALAQLERLPELLSRRRAVIDRYRTNLAGSGLVLQGGVRASGWMFACLLPEPLTYEDVAGRLREAQIETRPFFVPLHLLPMYGAASASSVRHSCPVAERIWKQGVCLPTHADLTMDEVDYVCEKVMEAVR